MSWTFFVTFFLPLLFIAGCLVGYLCWYDLFYSICYHLRVNLLLVNFLVIPIFIVICETIYLWPSTLHRPILSCQRVCASISNHPCCGVVCGKYFLKVSAHQRLNVSDLYQRWFNTMCVTDNPRSAHNIQKWQPSPLMRACGTCRCDSGRTLRREQKRLSSKPGGGAGRTCACLCVRLAWQVDVCVCVGGWVGGRGVYVCSSWRERCVRMKDTHLSAYRYIHNVYI